MIQSIAKLCIRLSIFPGMLKELVAAHSVGAGSRAYSEKRFSDAFKILKPVADYDIEDPYVGSAQYMVGMLYVSGTGVGKDDKLANFYFTKAAKCNNKDAIKYLSNHKAS